MVEKQKPQYDIVKRAAELIKNPQSATPEDIKRLSARVLDDERNAPQPNRVVPKPRPRTIADDLYEK